MDEGPARIRMGAETLNVKYNITIFSYQPFVLVEPYGAENITFGPLWSSNGEVDSLAYFDQEYTTPEDRDYKYLPSRRYSWFGKRDNSSALIVFAETDKTFPSTGTFQAGNNYAYVGVLGKYNPKVYFMPDEFDVWIYETMQENFEAKPRISEKVFSVYSILSSQGLNIESEKI